MTSTTVGLWLAAVVVLAALWFSVRATTTSRIRDWRGAEVATARYLRRRGCGRVSLTGAGADGGIDIVTRKLAVQVKHTSARVGRPVVQQLVGAASSGDRLPVIFATGGYSGPAHEFAENRGVALFDLRMNGRAFPANHHARRLRRKLRRH